jgi:hypothetical protein
MEDVGLPQSMCARTVPGASPGRRITACLSHSVRGRCRAPARVKKTGRIFRNLAKPGEIGPVRISKTPNYCLLFQNFKKKDKSQQKICKKTRSNSKVTNEEIFVKPSRLDW